MKNGMKYQISLLMILLFALLANNVESYDEITKHNKYIVWDKGAMLHELEYRGYTFQVLEIKLNQFAIEHVVGDPCTKSDFIACCSFSCKPPNCTPNEKKNPCYQSKESINKYNLSDGMEEYKLIAVSSGLPGGGWPNNSIYSQGYISYPIRKNNKIVTEGYADPGGHYPEGGERGRTDHFRVLCVDNEKGTADIYKYDDYTFIWKDGDGNAVVENDSAKCPDGYVGWDQYINDTDTRGKTIFSVVDTDNDDSYETMLMLATIGSIEGKDPYDALKKFIFDLNNWKSPSYIENNENELLIIQFDGGGSSQLWVRDPNTDKLEQKIYQSRKVFNAFVVRSKEICNSPFPDVHCGTWFHPFINELKNKEIVDGYDDGYFRPANNINRAEFLKMVIGASASDFIYSDWKAKGNPFPDVPEDAWFTPYVNYAEDKGIVDGYDDGYFRPANNVNRAEAAKIILKAFGFSETFDTVNGNDLIAKNEFPDVTFKDYDKNSGYYNPWYYSFIYVCKEKGIVNGYDDGEFKPGNLTNRAEASKMINLAMKAKK